MEQFWDVINGINGILFHDYVLYALLLTGLVFTVWSGFGQYRALTHGVALTLGRYDHGDSPGAISHFQALSTALSATVGLGNIAGVAVAVALGGPGAVFWMWIIGLLGMALKMTEVTQSMLYRDTSDPENPHGGPMFVLREGFARWGMGPVGKAMGAVFVVTLIISAITGGNMFQAWNVADITFTYFAVPKVATGIFLSVLVGAVVIGGVKRIGTVAGAIVPVMCVLYLMAAVYVLAHNLGEIPGMFALIVKSGLPGFLGGEAASPSGAFVGGSFGYALGWGIKRALFSSEAGQGSAPIAHAAVKTKEPVTEGVVAGLEPFIDTIVVCTLTALVILSSGAWNRGPESELPAQRQVVQVEAATADAPAKWSLELGGALQERSAEAKRVKGVTSGAGWSEGEVVFVLLSTGAKSEDTNADLVRLTGKVKGNDSDGWGVAWTPISAAQKPTLVGPGVYGDYAGASLTAYAFDRVTPGIGKWLVLLVVWLFALSTIISWSYYGEKGIVYLFGVKGVMPYRVVYCVLVSVSTLPLISTDAELDSITTLGLGFMLVANIPIMWIFGKQAMDAYHDYFRRIKSGALYGKKG
jgi:AGCS family alanine or glycine:cation symporter